MHVAEPGAAGEGEHGLGALHSDLEEFDWPRAQVPVAIGSAFRVGCVACFSDCQTTFFWRLPDNF